MLVLCARQQLKIIQALVSRPFFLEALTHYSHTQNVQSLFSSRRRKGKKKESRKHPLLRRAAPPPTSKPAPVTGACLLSPSVESCRSIMSAPIRISGRLARPASSISARSLRTPCLPSIIHNHPASRRIPQIRRRAPTTATTRPFSTTLSRCMAAPDDSFDPNTIERESDEVDVCIVGGGPFFSLSPMD